MSNLPDSAPRPPAVDRYTARTAMSKLPDSVQSTAPRDLASLPPDDAATAPNDPAVPPRGTAAPSDTAAPRGTASPLHPPIRTYGRRAERMTPAQAHTYGCRHRSAYYIDAERLPRLQAVVRQARLPLILEIGFGMGGATVAYARAHATHTVIACDVYCAGIARAIGLIAQHRLRNLYIVEGDAVALLPVLLAGSPAPLSGIHIFFPDPWPKRRHCKRRLVQAGTLAMLVALLKTGGHISFVSDHYDYAAAVAALTGALPLIPMYDQPLLCDARPRWRPETAFERKARRHGGHIYEVHCRRA